MTIKEIIICLQTIDPCLDVDWLQIMIHGKTSWLNCRKSVKIIENQHSQVMRMHRWPTRPCFFNSSKL